MSKNTPEQFYRNLSYGASQAQVIDLAFPKKMDETTKSLNAILFIHGGGWQGGDKSENTGMIVGLSQNSDFIAAAMNYRMFNEGADCSDMLADVDMALALIKSKAAEKGVTIHKIVLMGASAGAHLALLYSYKHHATSPVPIAFCVGMATPSDFTDPNLYSSSKYGNFLLDCASKLTRKQIAIDNYRKEAEVLLSISPVDYVTSTIPPTLLAHGSNDEIVPYSNATRLHQKLTAAGVKTALYTYPNSGHDLGKDPQVNDEFLKEVFAYMNIYMDKERSSAGKPEQSDR